MTDLTDLMRRATDDLDVPVTELVDRGVRRGRRRRHRRTAVAVLAGSCAVLAVAAGGALLDTRPPSGGGDLPAASRIADDPKDVATEAIKAFPPGGPGSKWFVDEVSANQPAPYVLNAFLRFGSGPDPSYLTIDVVRRGGTPVCPPPGGFGGTCEIRPDGSALMRYASPELESGTDRGMVGSVVELRRPDGVGVLLKVVNESDTLPRRHRFTLDELTALLDRVDWPLPSAVGPDYGPQPGQTPMLTRDGETVRTWDGRTVYAVAGGRTPSTPSR